MTFLPVASTVFLLLGFGATAAAQSGGVHVTHERVNAALAKGGVLIDVPQVRVAGGHANKPTALETQKGTTILYVTGGEGVFAAAERRERLTARDVIVVPAGTTQSFVSVSPSISYYVVTVPVLARGAKAEVV